MAKVVDGKKVASEVRSELIEDVKRLKQERGVTPTLALLLVKGDEPSERYVKRKADACEAVGIRPLVKALDQNIDEKSLIQQIHELNIARSVHGIMVQLPLPPHIDTHKVVSAISLEKDVDGLNPMSLGNILMGKGGFAAAGAEAALELLKRYEIPINGRHVVILGASEILGIPFAALSMRKEAVVTICPSDLRGVELYTKQADILLVDIAKPLAIKKEMVKKGCCIIDAGNNWLEGKLVGDVDFQDVQDVVSAITPVPGGLGPVLITMLLRNLVRAAWKLT